MNRNNGYINLFAALILIALTVGFTGTATAGGREQLDTSGRLKVEAGVVAGKSLASDFLGDSAVSNTSAHLGAGGGVGYRVTIGYGITKHIDIDLTASGQKGENREAADTWEATYAKNYILATVKYKIPFKSKLDQFKGQIKLGAGFGYYYDTSVRLKYYNSSVGSAYYGVDYEPVMGFHLSSEFETFMSKDWSLVLGFRLYFVDYVAEKEFNSGTYGTFLDSSTSLENMDGTGLEFHMSVARYFF